MHYGDSLGSQSDNHLNMSRNAYSISMYSHISLGYCQDIMNKCCGEMFRQSFTFCLRDEFHVFSSFCSMSRQSHEIKMAFTVMTWLSTNLEVPSGLSPQTDKENVVVSHSRRPSKPSLLPVNPSVGSLRMQTHSNSSHLHSCLIFSPVFQFPICWIVCSNCRPWVCVSVSVCVCVYLRVCVSADVLQCQYQ